MNDPANFGTDLDRPWNWPEDVLPYWSLKCENDTEPRYKPGKKLFCIKWQFPFIYLNTSVCYYLATTVH